MKHHHFQNITSTNDFVKELLGHNKLVAVTADYQLNGRGRHDSVWYGDYGLNVYCSVGIAHEVPPEMESLVLYQAIGCLAVKKTLFDVTNLDVFTLKYPNDVFAGIEKNQYNKIAGVLIENNFFGSNCSYSIIGMGLNVGQETFPPNLMNNPTSLKLLGFDADPKDVSMLLVHNIENYLKLPKD